jgi:hypothetical protein
MSRRGRIAGHWARKSPITRRIPAFVTVAAISGLYNSRPRTWQNQQFRAPGGIISALDWPTAAPVLRCHRPASAGRRRIKMDRIAVISDPHGNLTALTAALADIRRHQPASQRSF